MAVINQKPNMNYGVWAYNGNIEVPSSEKVELGWIIEKPLNEQMNWLQNRQDSMLQYINQHGIPEWDDRTEYPIDAFVARGGVVYKALSQNFDRDPTLNVAIWSVAFASFDNVAVIDSIRNEDGYLQHYVQKSNPVMLNVSKGVGYAGQDLSKGIFFDSNNNPFINISTNTQYNFNGTNTQDNDVIRKSDLQAILESYARYRVGDLYFTTNQENPSSMLGYGTWVLFAQGRAIVGLSDINNSKSPDWNKYVGGIFGEYEHTLNVNEMPKHVHQQGVKFTGLGKIEGYTESSAPRDDNYSLANTIEAGGSQPHNNVQPSVTVAIWKRTS